MSKRRVVALGVAVALLVPAFFEHSPQTPPASASPSVALTAKSVKVKPKPLKVDQSPGMKKLAKRLPGHSLAYYRRLAAFFVILENAQKRAAFAAWIEAISFPPTELRPVMQCIKDHESGNYIESSHPSSGSGAYQFTPGTWLTWFLRWRDSLKANDPYKFSYYALAFMAPQYVQDHVIVYTLQNGGAHNWDPRYGDDPCTLGLP